MSVWRGKFNKTSGTIVLDREAQTGTVDITIETDSVDLGLENYNPIERHRPGMFDVRSIPTATYKGKLAKFKDGPPTEVQGKLTLHGVTKPVTLDHPHVQVHAASAEKARIAVAPMPTRTFNRDDFGMTAARLSVSKWTSTSPSRSKRPSAD